MKKLLIIGLLVLTGIEAISAQSAKVNISIIGDEKDSYSINDTLQIQISVNISPEICNDGMEKTKTYLSGLDIIVAGKWKQKSTRQWEKSMQVLIRKNKRGISKITVFRKADKGDFFIQKKISVVE